MIDESRPPLPDPDRTILVPRPRVRALMPGVPEPAAKEALPAASATPNVGVNPLLAAANPLLALVPVLRQAAVSEPDALRRTMSDRVREFEVRAKERGLPPRKVVAARYVLCTFFDEIAARAPWGSSPAWSTVGLLAEFHSESRGGEKVFELLERLCDDPEANLDLLQLFHVVFSLGFEGRYREADRPRLHAIVKHLATLATVRPDDAHAPLSIRWQGARLPTQPLRAAPPAWVIAGLGAVALVAGYLFVAARLGVASGAMTAQLYALPASIALAKPAGPAVSRLAPLLAAEEREGLIEVRDGALDSTITLSADRWFAGEDAALDARLVPAILRIGRALAAQRGPVVVIGHLDDAPVRSLRYPTSWHLTRDRARNVSDALAEAGVPRDRLRAEGRADAEPVDSNATPEGRARNRRVEIVLAVPRRE